MTSIREHIAYKLAQFVAGFPGTNLTPEQVSGYVEQLSDLTAADVTRAIEHLRRTHMEFLPPASVIYATAVDLRPKPTFPPDPEIDAEELEHARRWLRDRLEQRGAARAAAFFIEADTSWPGLASLGDEEWTSRQKLRVFEDLAQLAEARGETADAEALRDQAATTRIEISERWGQ